MSEKHGKTQGKISLFCIVRSYLSYRKYELTGRSCRPTLPMFTVSTDWTAARCSEKGEF